MCYSKKGSLFLQHAGGWLVSRFGREFSMTSAYLVFMVAQYNNYFGVKSQFLGLPFSASAAVGASMLVFLMTRKSDAKWGSAVLMPLVISLVLVANGALSPLAMAVSQKGGLLSSLSCAAYLFTSSMRHLQVSQRKRLFAGMVFAILLGGAAITIIVQQVFDLYELMFVLGAPLLSLGALFALVGGVEQSGLVTGKVSSLALQAILGCFSLSAVLLGWSAFTTEWLCRFVVVGHIALTVVIIVEAVLRVESVLLMCELARPAWWVACVAVTGMGSALALYVVGLVFVAQSTITSLQVIYMLFSFWLLFCVFSLPVSLWYLEWEIKRTYSRANNSKGLLKEGVTSLKKGIKTTWRFIRPILLGNAALFIICHTYFNFDKYWAVLMNTSLLVLFWLSFATCLGVFLLAKKSSRVWKVSGSTLILLTVLLIPASVPAVFMVYVWKVLGMGVIACLVYALAGDKLLSLSPKEQLQLFAIGVVGPFLLVGGGWVVGANLERAAHELVMSLVATAWLPVFVVWGHVRVHRLGQGGVSRIALCAAGRQFVILSSLWLGSLVSSGGLIWVVGSCMILLIMLLMFSTLDTVTGAAFSLKMFKNRGIGCIVAASFLSLSLLFVLVYSFGLTKATLISLHALSLVWFTLWLLAAKVKTWGESGKE